jgi:hypothetical protein
MHKSFDVAKVKNIAPLKLSRGTAATDCIRSNHVNVETRSNNQTSSIHLLCFVLEKYERSLLKDSVMVIGWNRLDHARLDLIRIMH